MYLESNTGVTGTFDSDIRFRTVTGKTQTKALLGVVWNKKIRQEVKRDHSVLEIIVF